MASGSLVTFVDGFQSPPHIHNITYRAVVIRGRIHNDDPEAARLWMEPGSYWTQPAGEAPQLRAVTIQGTADVRLSGTKDAERLAPGSYFSSQGQASHDLACTGETSCILYVHTQGRYTVGPGAP